ncbi:MAG: hypothetical protein ACK5V3_06875 [Bdellovibrionales bacterium]
MILSILSFQFVSQVVVSQAWSASFNFLAEVEDVEKEMWWVITGKRVHSDGSPYRALQKALNEFQDKKKSSLRLSSCNRFQVEKNNSHFFRVSSLCLGKALWMGSLERTSKTENSEIWRLEVPLNSWTSHFGVGASIFHSQLKCELEVSPQNRLLKMSCPVYARNRSPEQFVELSDFQFNKNGKPTLKIEGYVKQPPELISKIESQVQNEGDIRIKETVYPRKQEEIKKIEFDHTQKGVGHGQKEKNDKESHQENNQENNQENKPHEGEGQTEEGESQNNEAPPIIPEVPPPTR